MVEEHNWYRGLGTHPVFESTGVITPALRELIIENRMMLDDDPITSSKFKIIVLMVLWSREQNLEPLIIEELLYDVDPELMH